MIQRKRRKCQSLDLFAIAFGINADYNFQQTPRGTKSIQTLQRGLVAGSYGSKQAAPGKMYVNLVSDAVQLCGKIFNRRPDEQNIRQAALCRFPGRFHRDLFQRLRVRIYPDVKLRGILSRALVHKATVAGPDIDDHSAGGKAR